MTFFCRSLGLRHGLVVLSISVHSREFPANSVLRFWFSLALTFAGEPCRRLARTDSSGSQTAADPSGPVPVIRFVRILRAVVLPACNARRADRP
jgi:hypothetical protein